MGKGLIQTLLLIILFIVAPSLTLAAVNVDDSAKLYKELFPEADRFSGPEGEPPLISAYKGEQQLGYIFRSKDFVLIPAYSGKPVDLLIGLDLQGKITAAKVMEHHEPILLVGIPEESLDDFAAQYRGKSVTDHIKVGSGKQEGYVNIDAITGATVTAMVINQTISRATRKVALAKKIIKDETATLPRAQLRIGEFTKKSWQELRKEGAVRNLHLTVDDVNKAFKGTKGEKDEDLICDPQDTDIDCNEFIDLYYAYLNHPEIGRNLLGDDQYKWLMSELKEGEHAIALMANGLYSFRGNGFVRGGIFDRIQLQQQGRIITFRDLDYYRLSDVFAEGIPDFSEMAIYIIRKENEFDPGSLFQLELLVRRQIGPLESVFTSFFGEYQLPAAYYTRPEVPKTAAGEEAPLWLVIWKQRQVEIVILTVALFLLTVLLLFQDVLVVHPVFLKRFRIGFLIFTVSFIGYYTLAQLSVVNVLTFVQAMMHDFRWQTFLIDPLIFILWAFVAMTLLLWGRGIFCGWLCPYGALQELINGVARYFNVRQLKMPEALHERLWALKYIILLVLFGVSLQSVSEAEKLAEIEPFKTAITLHFVREWGYVFYAAGLLALSTVNHKFYCKYLCPLGAALVIPGKWHLFDWLKRRRHCGAPCQICANECEIQAIDQNGAINKNECHYCLDCQVTYYDDEKCPPLIKKRKHREKAAKIASNRKKSTVVEFKST